jgi:hypothetical protein
VDHWWQGVDKSETEEGGEKHIEVPFEPLQMVFYISTAAYIRTFMV